MNPFKTLKNKVTNNKVKKNQVGIAPVITAQSIPEKLDPELAKYMWSNFKGKEFIPAEGYAADFLTLLREKTGLKKTTSNQLMPTDETMYTEDSMPKIGIAVQGISLAGSFGSQTSQLIQGEKMPDDKAKLASMGIVETSLNEIDVLGKALFFGCVPILSQLVSVLKIVKETHSLRAVHNKITACNSAHKELLNSASRNIAMTGLLTSLNEQKDDHKFKIGKFSMYLGVTVVPGGSLLRAGAEIAKYLLDIVNAVHLHQLILKVNKIISHDGDNPPKEFNLSLFKDFPLLANYLFIYPGTCAMLGITPEYNELSEKVKKELETNLNTLKEKKISLDDVHKKYASSIQKAAAKCVLSAPYVLTKKGKAPPGWFNSLRLSNWRKFEKTQK
jgi:hypothetical protein